MRNVLCQFLLKGSRALNVLLGASVAIMVVGFIAALLAMMLLG
jgi:hypothetical protein